MKKWLLLAALWLGLAAAAQAKDDGLLIQLQPGGAYRVWHAEGATQLSDDEAMLLDAIATPEGSAITPTEAGPAQAWRTAAGVVISLQRSGPDNELLVDRDACGHIKLWHSEGATQLTEDQLTDLVLAAIPGGGPRIVLDPQRLAKSFLTPLGVMIAIWRPPARTKQ